MTVKCRMGKAMLNFLTNGCNHVKYGNDEFWNINNIKRLLSVTVSQRLKQISYEVKILSPP
jgi:hypothetical protein